MAAICRTCTRPRNPQQLLCPRRWALAPKDLQDAVWAAYKPRARTPVDGLFRAVAAAIQAVESALAAPAAPATDTTKDGS